MSLRSNRLGKLLFGALLISSVAGIAIAQQPYFRFVNPGSNSSTSTQPGGPVVTPPPPVANNDKMTFGDGSIAPFTLRALVGEPVSLEFGTVGGVNPITWAQSPALPSNLLYADGVIYGTPLAPYSGNALFTANDATGAQAQARVTFDIYNAAVSLSQFKPLVRVGSAFEAIVGSNVTDPLYSVSNAPGATIGSGLGGSATVTGVATTPGIFPLTVSVTRAGTQIAGSTSSQVTVANPIALVFTPSTLPAISGPVSVTATAQNVVGSGQISLQSDAQSLQARGLTYSNGVLSGTLGVGAATALSLRLTDSADNSQVVANLAIPEIVAAAATIVIGESRPGDPLVAATGSGAPAMIQTDIPNPVCTVTQAVPGIEVSSSCVISGSPLSPGNYTLGVSIVPAGDPTADPVEVSAPVVVNPTLAASSPTPSISPPPGSPVALAVNTSGIVGTPSFELVGVTPAQLEAVGLSFDPATGAITGTVDPDVALAPQVKLTDSKDGKSVVIPFSIVTGPATVSTTLSTVALRGGDVRTFTSSTNIANAEFSLVGAPDYVTIDAQNGTVTITAPTVASLTTIPPFAVRATNAIRPSVFRQASVNSPGTIRQELVFTIAETASVRGNVALSVPFVTSGATTPQSVIHVGGSMLPPGMTVAANAVSGTPTTPGVYTPTLRFTDSSDGRSIERTVEITILPSLDFTLTSTVSPVGKGTVGVPLTITASAQNSLGTVTFENVAITGRSTLLSSAGLSITTAGLIQGTPTTPSSGNVNIRMTEVNNGVTTVIEKLLVLAVGAQQNASGLYPTVTMAGVDVTPQLYDATQSTNVNVPANGVIRFQFAEPVTVNGFYVESQSGRTITVKNVTTGATTSSTSFNGNNPIPQSTSDVWELTTNAAYQLQIFRLTFGNVAPIAPHFTAPVIGGASYYLTGKPMGAATPSGLTNATATAVWNYTGDLPPGTGFNPATGSITGTPTTPGIYNVSLGVSDGRNISAARANVTFNVKLGTSPYGKFPAISGIAGDPQDILSALYDSSTSTPVSLAQNQVVTFTFDEPVTANQLIIGGNVGSWLITAVDEGVSFTEDSYYGYNSFRRQDGNANLPAIGTSQTWTFRRTDSAGSISSLQLSQGSFNVPYAPAATYNASMVNLAGVSQTQTPTGVSRGSISGVAQGTTDATFQIVSGTLPNPMTINATTGVISGAPTVPGTYVVKASLVNSIGVRSVPSTITIEVLPAATAANELPVITGPADGTAARTILYDVDTSSKYTLASNATLTYTFDKDVTLNGIRGTASGGHNIRVTNVTKGVTLYTGTEYVKDFALTSGSVFTIQNLGGGNLVLDDLTLSYSGNYVRLPNVTSTAFGTTAKFIRGNAITAIPLTQANTSPANTGTYSVVSGTMPPGLNFVGNTIGGTPNTVGVYPLSIVVTDSRGVPSVAKSLTIEILPSDLASNEWPTFGGVADPAFALKAMYDADVTSDSVLTLANNASITLNFSKSISFNGIRWAAPGSPTIRLTNTDTGATLYQGTSQASDFSSAASGQNFTFTNLSGAALTLQSLRLTYGGAAPVNPSVSATAFGTTVRTVRNAAMTAIQVSYSGLTGSPIWSMSGHPPELSISAGGSISGTPATAGNYTVSVFVADSRNRPSIAKTFTLEVLPSETAADVLPTLSGLGDPDTLRRILYDKDQSTASAITIPANGTITYTFAQPTTVSSINAIASGTSAPQIVVRNETTNRQVYAGAGSGGNYTLAEMGAGTVFTVRNSTGVAITATEMALSYGGLHVNIPSMDSPSFTGKVGYVRNAAFTITPTVSNVSTPAVWSYSGTIPTGASFNTSTGAITGPATGAGSFSATLSVTDARGLTAISKTNDIVILPTENAGNTLPTVTGIGDSATTTQALLDNNGATTVSTPNGTSLLYTYATPVAASRLYFLGASGTPASVSIRITNMTTGLVLYNGAVSGTGGTYAYFNPGATGGVTVTSIDTASAVVAGSQFKVEILTPGVTLIRMAFTYGTAIATAP